MAKPKPQRIRDPIHNLITFGDDQFEHGLWKVIQTAPFQRLRRIRQLGFSEFVFPGATHSRFAHSLGVFHLARELVKVIQRYTSEHHQQFKDHQAKHALAAALLHDVGHGMFSHAFETIGKEFGWQMARHERVSQNLIRHSEISQLLDDEFGLGFAGNVADVIFHDMPANLYGSVVSSQFDADRLDYMQRDRLMTGVQSSGVDPTWLLANLEVGEVSTGSDEDKTGVVETLVLGPKAVQAAESYVLALFHLYPNVYLHKTTRGIEVLFQALMRRIVHLERAGHSGQIGLPRRHPLIRFVEDPSDLDRALALDDSVFWGALAMLFEADDEIVRRLSSCLRDRHLACCFDLRQMIESELASGPMEPRPQRQARIKLICDATVRELNAIGKGSEQREKSGELHDLPRFLVDQYARHPYKRFQDSKSPLNQILIRIGADSPRDMGELSPIIANAEPFNVCRAYAFRDDVDAKAVVEDIVRTKVRENQNVQ